MLGNKNEKIASELVCVQLAHSLVYISDIRAVNPLIMLND